MRKRARLVDILVVSGDIDLEKAFALINFDGINIDGLTPPIRRVADICWLLKQDSDVSVLEPTGDNLLAEALHSPP